MSGRPVVLFNTKIVLVLSFLIVLTGSPLARGECRVCVLDVPHDGYCFYHAVAKQLTDGPSGFELYFRLATFLFNTSAVDNPQLENLLRSEPIASSTFNLKRRLLSFTPDRMNPLSWAGIEDAVAMSHMLGLPVLVLHITADQQVANDSFLVNSEGVFPLATLIDSQEPVPAIQLIISGSEWSAVRAENLTESRTGTLGSYITRMTSVLNERIATGHVLATQESEPCSGQQSLHERPSENSIDGEFLMPGSDSMQALQRIRFSSQWQQLIIKYIEMKSAIYLALADNDMIRSSEYGWSSARLENLAKAVNDLSTIFLSGFTQRIIAPLINDYLSVIQIGISDFLRSLMPSERNLWELLATLKPVLDKPASRGFGFGLSFGGISSSLLSACQGTDTTLMDRVDLTAETFTPLPSGRQHPDVIQVTRGTKVVEFDAADPLHHILFALYVTARSYDIACQCLRLFQSTPEGELASILSIEGDARAYIESQLVEFDNALTRIRALIHAIGRHRYPDIWQPGHYQALTICDNRFIVFHSDDFQPRTGWQDLLPPECVDSDAAVNESRDRSNENDY